MSNRRLALTAFGKTSATLGIALCVASGASMAQTPVTASGFITFGSPSVEVTSSENPYFALPPPPASQIFHTSVKNVWTASDPNRPEVGFESVVSSTTGYGQPSYKQNFNGVMVCGAGSGECEGINLVAQVEDGYLGVFQGQEIDLNYNRKADADPGGGANAAYNLSLSGGSGAGYLATAGLYIARGGTSKVFQNAVLVNVGVRDASFRDIGDSDASIKIEGHHYTSIDISGSNDTYQINARNMRLLPNGSMSIGSTMGIAQGVLLTHGASNENIVLGGHMSNPTGASFRAVDDSQAAFVPLEISASSLRVSSPTLVAGRLDVGGDVGIAGAEAIAGLATIAGAASVGTTAAPTTGVLFAHGGTDENITLGGNRTSSTGASIQALNDAQTGGVPLEIASTDLLVSSRIDIGGDLAATGAAKISGALSVGGATSIGTTNLPTAGSMLVRSGTDADLQFRPAVHQASGATINSVNDAQNALAPLELLASNLLLYAEVQVIGRIDVKSTLALSQPLMFASSPTIGSGFGSGATISSNGTATFRVTVGAGGTDGVGTINLPTADNAWNCMASNMTTTSVNVFMTKVTAATSGSITLMNFSNAAVNRPWSAGDILTISCASQ